MADDSARRTEMDQAEVERRIQALERQAIESQPPASAAARQPDELEQKAESRGENEAHTSGLLWLLAGLVLMGGGLVQYLSRLTVWSGYWFLGGQPPIGLLFIPFILGIALALMGGRVLRLIGVVVVAVSLVAIFGASLRNMVIFLRPTPFLDVAGMLALVGIGLGLVVRGLRRL